jgi:hypothetical protein
MTTEATATETSAVELLAAALAQPENVEALQNREVAKINAATAEKDAEIEALKAELLASQKGKPTKKKGKPTPTKKKEPMPELVFIDRAVKCEQGTDIPLTGKKAGMWAAQFGINPLCWQHKSGARPEYHNVEKIRAVLNNLAEARKILKQIDAANAAE